MALLGKPVVCFGEMADLYWDVFAFPTSHSVQTANTLTLKYYTHISCDYLQFGQQAVCLYAKGHFLKVQQWKSPLQNYLVYKLH